MLAVSKRSDKPTTYFSLAFFTQIVAFAILLLGIFTPYWSRITEEIGNSVNNIEYDKGLVVSCLPHQGCSGITDFSDLSDIFFASFVLGIIAVVLGFLALQMFCAGLCIRSCRETNLSVPIAALSIFQGALLMLILVLFEVSLGLETLPGNLHRGDTFGFSRGLIVGAIVLYFIASFFIIGEHMMRTESSPRTPPVQIASMETKRRSRPRHSKRERDSPRRRPVTLPPPYTRANQAYYPDTEEKHYSAANGIRPCKLPGCEMCSFVTGSPTFWGPAGVFNIIDRLTCQDSKVVYAIVCVRDDKVFIGHSQQKLVETFSTHLANIKSMRVHDPVAYHFTRAEHSVLDLRISALARINCDSDTRARLEKSLSYDMDRPHNSYYGINENFEFL